MAGRAYFLIKLEEGVEQQDFAEEVLSLDGEWGEIEAVDPVLGEHDFVIAMESKEGTENLVELLEEEMTGVKEVMTLKVVAFDSQVKKAEEKLKEMLAES